MQWYVLCEWKAILCNRMIFQRLTITNLLLFQLPESPNFKVKVSLNVKKGGGPKSQFYLLDIGSCWKNNGAPCDGDVLTDVTRYSEMIINPQTAAWCSPTNLNACPPYHITPQDKKIYRNDTANFPYGAYHYYCSPGNAMHLEQPISLCDPYSNPQAQELVQILPHPIWAEYGYPTKQGEGWIGDPRTWELDVGGLSSRLYFYQVSLPTEYLETIFCLIPSIIGTSQTKQASLHMFSACISIGACMHPFACWWMKEKTCTWSYHCMTLGMCYHSHSHCMCIFFPNNKYHNLHFHSNLNCKFQCHWNTIKRKLKYLFLFLHCRILVPLLREEYGHRWMLEQKYL